MRATPHGLVVESETEGSGHAATMPISMPTMLRPRHDFPTPLFKVVVPLLLAAIAVLVFALVR
jgi:hypothetical protein